MSITVTAPETNAELESDLRKAGFKVHEDMGAYFVCPLNGCGAEELLATDWDDALFEAWTLMCV